MISSAQDVSLREVRVNRVPRDNFTGLKEVSHRQEPSHELQCPQIPLCMLFARCSTSTGNHLRFCRHNFDDFVLNVSCANAFVFVHYHHCALDNVLLRAWSRKYRRLSCVSIIED